MRKIIARIDGEGHGQAQSGTLYSLPIRLIAIDIDGTLLDRQARVPEANVRAVAEATARGIEVALVTGRRFDFARPVIDQLPAPVTLVVNNGALIKDAAGTTLLRHLLPRDVGRAVLAATVAARDTTALLFDRPAAGQIVVERLDTSYTRWQRYLERFRDVVIEVTPLEAALEEEDPLQIMFTGPVEPMRAIRSILLASTGTRCSIALTEYEANDFSLVDVIRCDCSKGSAVRELAAMRGLSRDEVMAMGDNYNDLEMLTFAGTPVVMGNAVSDLKARGWHVTATNDEAGVAAAIARFALRSG